MDIEQFIAQSQGEWRSMRSGHSLAFQQFEQVLSKIKIELLSLEDPSVLDLLESNTNIRNQPTSPFKIEWEAESDWEPNDESSVASGISILIPFPCTPTKGIILRSLGYAEAIKALTNYSFLSDGTLTLSTKYHNTIAEERIWFANSNLRCRSSILRTSKGSGILQTSFASEVRRLNS